MSRARRKVSRSVGAMLERLEVRELMAVALTRIDRLSSAGLLNRSIRDGVALTTQGDGSKTGATDSLVGYDYQGIRIGGMGLDIHFSSDGTSAVGSRPVVLQVDWGDATPAQQQSFNPTFQSVYRTDSRGRVDWSDEVTLPHIYGREGKFTVVVTATQVPLPDGTGGSEAKAVLTIDVGHVIRGNQGLFLRGTTGTDRVDATPGMGGVVVAASFLGSTITTTATDVYVDLLNGDDRFTADPVLGTVFHVDAGGGNDFVQGGAGGDRLLGGPGDDVVNGLGGDDEIVGAAGADRLDGGVGNDTVDGGSGRDSLVGGLGNDIVLGGADDDAMEGDDGADFLLGGLGRDVVQGGPGDDVLAGGYATSVGPNLGAGSILRAWGAGDFRGASAGIRRVIVQASTDLINVPFAKLANGSTRSPRLKLGPNVANDAARDLLDAGDGRDLVAASRIGSRRDDDRVVKGPGQTTVLALRDRAPATVRRATAFTGYVSSNGLDIVRHPTRDTILLYRTQPDGVNLFRTLPFAGIDSTRFARFYGRYRPAELTVDNVTDFAKFANPLDVYWSGFNRPFLAYAAAFGSVIETSSDPFDPKNLYHEQTAARSAFGRELRYLRKASSDELFPSPFPAYMYDPLRRLYYQPA